MNSVWAILLVLAVSLNVVVTVLVVRSHMYSAKQAAFQIVLAWIAPLIGSIIAFGVLRSLQAKSERLDQLRILGEIWRSANQDDPGPESSHFDSSGHGRS